MLLRLFAWPLLLLGAAVVAFWFLGFLVPSLFEGSPYLAALDLQLRVCALLVAWVLVGAATVVSAYQTARLWRWSAGRAELPRQLRGDGQRAA